YAERLGRSANSFDELYQKLNEAPTYIDQITLKLLTALLQKTNPKIVGFSFPLPGTSYSAFRCAQYIKPPYPNIKIVMGGGFPNTELRSVSDVRVFEFFDFINLDDGEAPTEQLIKFVTNKIPQSELKRTFVLENDQVKFINNPLIKDYKQSEI